MTLHTQLLWTTQSSVSPPHNCGRFLPHIPIKSVPLYHYTLPSNCWIHVPLCWEIATILWAAGGYVLIAEVGDKSLKECEEKRKKKDTSLTKERTSCASLKTRKILQHTGDTDKSYCQTGNTSCCSFLCAWLQSELPSYATLAKVRKHRSKVVLASRMEDAVTFRKESFFLILYKD